MFCQLLFQTRGFSAFYNACEIQEISMSCLVCSTSKTVILESSLLCELCRSQKSFRTPIVTITKNYISIIRIIFSCFISIFIFYLLLYIYIPSSVLSRAGQINQTNPANKQLANQKTNKVLVKLVKTRQNQQNQKNHPILPNFRQLNCPVIIYLVL